MLHVQPGQCGLCAHFGEERPERASLVKIRLTHQAPEDLLERCAHPRHSDLHLIVSPVSTCDGFTPAAIPQQEPARA